MLVTCNAAVFDFIMLRVCVETKLVASVEDEWDEATRVVPPP